MRDFYITNYSIICQKWGGLVEWSPMKTDIHPKYHLATATCASCGAQVVVGSTMEKIEMEICSQCHPLFTGLEKALDTGGRVEKFRSRAVKAAPKKTTK